MTFLAQHPSICAACDQHVQVDDPIVLAGGAGWVHEICPEPPKPRPVCGTCFLEIPLSGACTC